MALDEVVKKESFLVKAQKYRSKAVKYLPKTVLAASIFTLGSAYIELDIINNMTVVDSALTRAMGFGATLVCMPEIFEKLERPFKKESLRIARDTAISLGFGIGKGLGWYHLLLGYDWNDSMLAGGLIATGTGLILHSLNHLKNKYVRGAVIGASLATTALLYYSKLSNEKTESLDQSYRIEHKLDSALQNEMRLEKIPKQLTTEILAYQS